MEDQIAKRHKGYKHTCEQKHIFVCNILHYYHPLDLIQGGPPYSIVGTRSIIIAQTFVLVNAPLAERQGCFLHQRFAVL